MGELPRRVLFLCSANSIRSPLAEGLWRSLVDGADVSSAGALGSGSLHPLVEVTLLGYGVTLERFRSRSVDELEGQAFDLVVTLSAEAQQAFPEFPGAGETLHWPTPDPLLLPGTRPENFQAVAQMLVSKMEQYLRGRD